MNADDNADSRIIEQLRARDPAGIARAYDRYGRAAYALFVRITHDSAAAEDLVQELFLRLWNRSREFDSAKGSLGVWILSIARNMAIDYARSAQTRFANRLQSMDRLETLCFAADPSRPETRIDDVRAVQAAFATLSADERRVIELAYFEGFSQSEIAANTKQPLGTVKSRMRAALGRMRSAIAGSQKP
jgi:RNA polymerase sigma-70 factor, ECF subfamily